MAHPMGHSDRVRDKYVTKHVIQFRPMRVRPEILFTLLEKGRCFFSEGLGVVKSYIWSC